RVLLWSGNIALDQGDLGRAAPWFEEALACSREVSDGRIAGLALRQPETTMRIDAPRVRKKGIAGLALTHLGIVARELGDLVRARALIQQSLAIHREEGADEWFTIYPLHNLGLLAEDLADDADAQALYRDSLTAAARPQ